MNAKAKQHTLQMLRRAIDDIGAIKLDENNTVDVAYALGAGLCFVEHWRNGSGFTLIFSESAGDIVQSCATQAAYTAGVLGDLASDI